MVQQILPNTYRDWTAAYERGKSEGEAQKLKGLASLAYGSSQADRQSILGQMAGISPDFAAKQEEAFNSQEDRRKEQLAGMARGWKSVPSEQRQAYYERFMAPSISAMGFGDPGPYDEAAVDGVATQFLAAYGGGKAHNPHEGLPYDIQSLKILQSDPTLAALDRERRQAAGMVPKLVETNQGIGWGTPGAGINLAPIEGVAGSARQAPQPSLQAGLYQTPAGMVRIGEGLTPEQQQVALMDIQGGGKADSVQLPARNVAPQQFGGAQNIAQPVQKHQAPSELDRRIETARAMGASEDEIRRLVLGKDGSAPDAKPIPVGSLNKVLEAQDALGSTQVISDIIQKHARRMQSGELIVGPVDTIGAKFRTGLGMANAQDVNLNEWEADKTKIVNESLRLNKGVQTEGDAQRAVQELMGARDQATAARALRRLAELNARAVQLQKQKLTTIYGNYGRGADGEPVQRRQPAQGGGVDDLLSKYGAN